MESITLALSARLAWWWKPCMWLLRLVGRFGWVPSNEVVLFIARRGVRVQVDRGLRLRPFPMRFWRSYVGWRQYLGVWASLRAAWQISTCARSMWSKGLKIGARPTK